MLARRALSSMLARRALSSMLAQRALSQSARAQGSLTSAALNAVAFDVDGVLARGSKALPGAREALHKLHAAKIPFVLLTNGGGEPEPVKAAKLTKELGVYIDEHQLVLSHSPLRPVIESCYADKRILVLGCRDVVGVSRHYGAKDIVTVDMLAADDGNRYPFRTWPQQPLPDRHKPISAVFVLHDPNNWGAEIQITLDVLRGHGQEGPLRGVLGAGSDLQTVPYFASNPDTTFAGAYEVPRLAGGAYTVCLQAAYRAVTGGHEMTVVQCGKPTSLTYAFAEYWLRQWLATAQHMGHFEEPLEDVTARASSIGYAAMAQEYKDAAAEVRRQQGGGMMPGELEYLQSLQALLQTQQLKHGDAHPAVSLPLLPSSTAGAGAQAAPAVQEQPSALPFHRIWMVGDNPAADIQGANRRGGPWRSILVRTGVFKGQHDHDNHPHHPATHCRHGVAEAVQLIVEKGSEGRGE